jgi:Trypsin-co-occurring domain 1
VSDLVRIPLGGGACILVEGNAAEDHGPIQAGRVGDLITDAAQTLQEALKPVAQASRTVLEELRKANPDEVEVEFGVEFKAESGAVIARAGGASHLTVKLTWKASPYQAAVG